MSNEQKQPALAGQVERKVGRLRVAATVLVPLAVLALGVLMAALTSWLQQHFGGNTATVLLLVLALAWIGRMVWNWPEWRRDKDA